ncbi:Slp family lipoprotein [Flocculibacter collagenilyticus]|uniref:Slp family lipoprotein n=1 Tax=Flocculibacter collagenilyticus TaxID=2744479 RepID=UPI0018F375CA|nr:Slp family lipoprotein [Flocculibacter collagenilyticus]
MLIQRLYIILASIILSGCAATYPDKITVSPDTQLLAYNQISENTPKQLARWGGVIADIKNEKNRTRLEVANFKLKSYGRPIVNDNVDGRFYVYTDQFLDPLVYKKGRSVTVLGTYEGLTDGKIGEFEYKFPTLVQAKVHIWKEIKEVEIEYIDPWPYWHYPYYHHRMYGPKYKKIKTQHKSNNDNNIKNTK